MNSMKKLMILLVFSHAACAVKHSLKFFFTASSGVPSIPEFLIAAEIDESEVVYCDINERNVKPKQDWMGKILRENRPILNMLTHSCFEKLPNIFKAALYNLMQIFKQHEDAHIMQLISGCELNEKTGKVSGFLQLGYNGEDFMTFDMKTLSWIAQKTQAVITKQIWDIDKDNINDNKKFYTLICPKWLSGCLSFANISQQRTDLPSVSLLQKTPSCPVSCHATGFYPDRVVMFWTKDEEEIHEGVDLGEILPNHDGTFQMSVYLNVTSFTPKQWRRYNCVFQLFGVKDDIVTKLDKAAIRTNYVEPRGMSVPIITAAVSLALILVAVTGYVAYKKKKATRHQASPDNSTELSEKLSADT